MKITIRAHRGIGLGSQLVRAWTRSPWGHVDLVFENNDLALDVRPSVGLSLTPIEQVPAMGDSISRSYLVPDFVADPVFALMCQEQGSPYDWNGAAAAGIPWLAREHPQAWFCSEAVWTAMNQMRLAPGLPAWRRTPADIADLIAIADVS